MQKLGDLAQGVLAQANEARRDNVIDGPWLSEKDREIVFQDKCGQFAEGMFRLCARAERDLGISSVRGIVAAVLAQIDEQIEKDGGNAA